MKTFKQLMESLDAKRARALKTKYGIVTKGKVVGRRLSRIASETKKLKDQSPKHDGTMLSNRMSHMQKYFGMDAKNNSVMRAAETAKKNDRS